MVWVRPAAVLEFYEDGYKSFAKVYIAWQGKILCLLCLNLQKQLELLTKESQVCLHLPRSPYANVEVFDCDAVTSLHVHCKLGKYERFLGQTAIYFGSANLSSFLIALDCSQVVFAERRNMYNLKNENWRNRAWPQKSSHTAANDLSLTLTPNHECRRKQRVLCPWAEEESIAIGCQNDQPQELLW